MIDYDADVAETPEEAVDSIEKAEPDTLFEIVDVATAAVDEALAALPSVVIRHDVVPPQLQPGPIPGDHGEPGRSRPRRSPGTAKRAAAASAPRRVRSPANRPWPGAPPARRRSPTVTGCRNASDTCSVVTGRAGVSAGHRAALTDQQRVAWCWWAAPRGGGSPGSRPSRDARSSSVSMVSSSCSRAATVQARGRVRRAAAAAARRSVRTARSASGRVRPGTVSARPASARADRPDGVDQVIGAAHLVSGGLPAGRRVDGGRDSGEHHPRAPSAGTAADAAD